MTKKPRLGEDPLSFIQDSRKQVKPQVKKQAQAKSQAKAKTLAQAHAKMQANSQAIKEQVLRGGKPGKFEEIRTRRTYWLTAEDIEKIDRLAADAGIAKHDIIAAAVNMLCAYVYNKEEGQGGS